MGSEAETKPPRGSAALVGWIIRPATLLDRDACAELLEESYRTLLQPDYTPECLAQCLPLLIQPRDELLTCQTWYVAEHPSTRQLVGCGGWTVNQPKSMDDTPATCVAPIGPHMRHFAVHPDFVRMGVASAIWKRCQADIQTHFARENRPFPFMEAFSTITAESFYQSLGFAPVKRVDLELVQGTKFTSILMRRDPPE